MAYCRGGERIFQYEMTCLTEFNGCIEDQHFSKYGEGGLSASFTVKSFLENFSFDINPFFRLLKAIRAGKEGEFMKLGISKITNVGYAKGIFCAGKKKNGKGLLQSGGEGYLW